MGILLYQYMPDYVPPIEVKNVASNSSTNNATNTEPKDTVKYWQAPDIATLEGDSNKDFILYGIDLIAHTSEYFRENGKIFNSSTNGMNCQNCHLDAGTSVFGNNYSAVASTYPKFRARSGVMENIYKHVNDCFERSLNGRALDTVSKEMQGIVAYIKWLGKDVPKGISPEGSGLKKLAFLERAARYQGMLQTESLSFGNCPIPIDGRRSGIANIFRLRIVNKIKIELRICDKI